MTQAPNSNFILRAADLSHAAPREWAGFIQELRGFADLQKQQCVQAPLAMLQVAQGRAQTAVQLLELLENAAKTAAAITQAGRK